MLSLPPPAARSQSVEILNRSEVQIPENTLTVHQARVQKSLEKLNLPSWYKPSATPVVPRWKRRESEKYGGWKRDSRPSTPGSTYSTPCTSYTRWSTNRLNRDPSPSPSNFSIRSLQQSTGASLSTYRKPYLGWRSQEGVNNILSSPSQRLAASVVRDPYRRSHSSGHQDRDLPAAADPADDVKTSVYKKFERCEQEFEQTARPPAAQRSASADVRLRHGARLPPPSYPPPNPPAHTVAAALNGTPTRASQGPSHHTRGDPYPRPPSDLPPELPASQPPRPPSYPPPQPPGPAPRLRDYKPPPVQTLQQHSHQRPPNQPPPPVPDQYQPQDPHRHLHGSSSSSSSSRNHGHMQSESSGHIYSDPFEKENDSARRDTSQHHQSRSRQSSTNRDSLHRAYSSCSNDEEDNGQLEHRLAQHDRGGKYTQHSYQTQHRQSYSRVKSHDDHAANHNGLSRSQDRQPAATAWPAANTAGLGEELVAAPLPPPSSYADKVTDTRTEPPGGYADDVTDTRTATDAGYSTEVSDALPETPRDWTDDYITIRHQKSPNHVIHDSIRQVTDAIVDYCNTETSKRDFSTFKVPKDDTPEINTSVNRREIEYQEAPPLSRLSDGGGSRSPMLWMESSFVNVKSKAMPEDYNRRDRAQSAMS